MLNNSNCTDCPLHEEAQTVCMRGRGDKNATIMFVGEAPGASEDKEGRPFVGRAGALLSKVLEEVGFDEEDIYITNVNKCRPPHNKKPTQSQINKCRKYLQSEFFKVKPKFVVLLGAHALTGVLGIKGIQKLRGRPIKRKASHNDILSYDFEAKGPIDTVVDTVFFPIMHPAYILRFDGALPQFKNDLQQFKKLVEGGGELKHKGYTTNIVRIDKPSEVVNMLADISKSNTVAWDTETTSLQPKKKFSAINSIQIATGKTTYSVPLAHPSYQYPKSLQKRFMKSLAKAMADCKNVVTFNGKFDYKWCKEVLGVEMPMTDDAQIMHSLLDERGKQDLETLAQVEYDAPRWDVDLEIKTGEVGDFDKDLAPYGGLDAFYTRKLFFTYKRRLKKESEVYRLYIELYKDVPRAYADLELCGIYLDPKETTKAQKQLTKEVGDIEQELNEYGKINWNSPAQVKKVFDELDLPTESTDKLSLKMLAHQGEDIAKKLLKYREKTKLLSFVEGWQKENIDNRIYPSFKITGTETGRPSCNDPNLQQVPRDKLVRGVFKAPKGWQQLEIDFSQIELRIAAHLAYELNMIEIYNNDGDIHTSTASAVSGFTYEEIEEGLADSESFKSSFWYNTKAKEDWYDLLGQTCCFI